MTDVAEGGGIIASGRCVGTGKYRLALCARMTWEVRFVLSCGFTVLMQPPPTPPAPPPPPKCYVALDGVFCLQSIHILSIGSGLAGLLLLCLLAVVCRCWLKSRRQRHTPVQRSDDDKSVSGGAASAPAGTPSKPPAELTRSTTLLRKASGKVTIEEDDGGDAAKPGALPDGWQAQEDADGNRYFWNGRDMSWTRPTGTGPTGAAAHAAASVAVAIAIDHSVGSGESHAAGWTEHYDAESGCVYYYHSESRQACWTLPS